ncbi:MAG: hypothetical protein WD735_03855, partial [Balneolaceae bacterium]
AVSLHPVVPGWSKLKLGAALPLVGLGTRYLNPQWGIKAEGFMPGLIRGLVELTHHECENSVCKQVSFTYGSGFPALWEHENLNEETHEWLKNEFAEVPIRFFKHIKQCVAKGHLISTGDENGLPEDFEAIKPQTDARFVLFAGEKNRCFLPESQVRTYNYLEKYEPGRHALHLLPKYSHLDVFMGKEAAKDVFPMMVQELEAEL